MRTILDAAGPRVITDTGAARRGGAVVSWGSDGGAVLVRVFRDAPTGYAV